MTYAATSYGQLTSGRTWFDRRLSGLGAATVTDLQAQKKEVLDFLESNQKQREDWARQAREALVQYVPIFGQGLADQVDNALGLTGGKVGLPPAIAGPLGTFAPGVLAGINKVLDELNKYKKMLEDLEYQIANWASPPPTETTPGITNTGIMAIQRSPYVSYLAPGALPTLVALKPMYAKDFGRPAPVMPIKKKFNIKDWLKKHKNKLLLGGGVAVAGGVAYLLLREDESGSAVEGV